MPPGTGKVAPGLLAWAASVVTDREIRDWQDFYSAAAMSNKVYLCPGSYWVQTNGGYVHRADLHSPEGRSSVSPYRPTPARKRNAQGSCAAPSCRYSTSADCAWA